MKSLILCFFALPLLAGCGDPSCVNGNTGTCEETCDEGGCEWEADGAGTKDYTCDGGDCALAVSGAGTVSLDCGGGGCTVEASGSGTVSVACSGGACDMTCSGQGTCKMTDCDSGDCTNECTSVTARCEGP